MAVTQTAAITAVRSIIDEPVAQFWTDTELGAWINEAVAVTQREVECFQKGPVAITTTAAVQTYLLPSDVLRVHRVEFVPATNTSYTYSLDFRGYNEMDAAWASLKTLPAAWPDLYTLWNNPNNTGTALAGLNLLLYPVPSVAGTLNLYYLRVTVPTVAGTDYVDVLPGWENTVFNYAAYRALRKDADPRWKDFRDEFQADLERMKTVTRTYSDQAGTFSTGSQNYNPLFLDLD